jgi:hypothetical protein
MKITAVEFYAEQAMKKPTETSKKQSQTLVAL